jgi:addiction module RelE/StbE family toxin
VLVTKEFKKQLEKLVQSQPNRAKKVAERIKLFKEDRTNPILRDHELSGNLEGKRSFSVAGDLRIIYKEEKENELTIYFITIGSHSQVY